MMDALKRNANLVEALGSALREGNHAVGTVPGLLKRILVEESWCEFVTQRGELVSHADFAAFITAPPLRGIGASVDLVRRMVADDITTTDLLEAALKRRRGRPVKVDNINLYGAEPPRGTSRAYALQRLRQDAPTLHAEVIAGHLSAHAAMVKAGFRSPTFSVRAESAETVAETLKRRLPPEMVAEIAVLLAA